MKRPELYILFLVVTTLACSQLSSPSNTAIPPVSVNASDNKNSALVNVYDPSRNPADDLQQAIVMAQNENKRIMLELGGDWCIWCKFMDDFYATHDNILKFRAENYVLVKINVSEENSNEAFLSQFPEVAGYPHIYILDSDGTFLHSQNTAELEDGADSYVPEVFMGFLEKWAPSQ